MTDAPNPKTFDLSAALSGRSFPEIVVPVFFDEALQLELSDLDQVISRTAGDVTELEKAREDLLENFKAGVIRVRVKGAPRDVRKATIDKVLDEHPQEFTAFGQAKPNRKGDEAYAEAVWNLHVVEITGPDGSRLVPTPEDLALFRKKAPDTAIIAVEKAIDKLTSGSKSGYETAVQDLDFLSQP